MNSEDIGAENEGSMNKSEIYVSHDSHPYGPVSHKELLELLEGGTISKDDFAFIEGMVDWVPVSEMLESFSPDDIDLVKNHATDEAVTSKVVPEPKPTPKPILKSEHKSEHKPEYKPKPAKKKIIIIVAIVFLLCLVSLTLIYFLSDGDDGPRKIIKSESVMDEADEPEMPIESESGEEKSFPLELNKTFPSVGHSSSDENKSDPNVNVSTAEVLEKVFSKPSIKGIEEVGAYEGEDGLRYFAFYVKGFEGVAYDDLPASLIPDLKKHGSERENTKGALTVSFYYTEKGKAPDISKMNSAEANDAAYAAKAYLAVCIMEDGDLFLIDRP